MKYPILIIALVLLCYSCENDVCIIESTEAINDSMIRRKQVDDCNDKIVLKEQNFKVNLKGDTIADGPAVFYNKDGVIEEKLFFLENSLFGPQSYFENGNLSRMDYFTSRKVKWLSLYFNEDGGIHSADGKLIHITLTEQFPYFDSIPIHSPLRLIQEVATIDKMLTVLNIKIKRGNLLLMDTIIDKFHPVLNTYMTGTQYFFKEKGNYTFFAEVNLIDSITGKKLCIDTFSRKITVY